MRSALPLPTNSTQALLNVPCNAILYAAHADDYWSPWSRCCRIRHGPSARTTHSASATAPWTTASFLLERASIEGDTALVVVRVEQFDSGLFGSGSSDWQQDINLVREADGWKIDDAYVCV